MTKFVSPVRFSSTHSSSVISVTSAAAVGYVADQQTDQNLPKDRPFNGFRGAKSEKAKKIISDIVAVVESFETKYQPRGRPRRPKDQQAFERQVEAIVCDLAHREIMKPGAWLAISFDRTALGTKDRYRPKALNQAMPRLVRIMADQLMQYVELRMGFHSPFNKAAGRQTTVRAGPRLRKLMSDHGLGLEDFRLDTTEEIVILKDSKDKDDHWDKGEWLPYCDTPQTIQYREELRRINDHLEKAEIEFIPPSTWRTKVDDTERRLRRYFSNGSFEHGGRLFGGFWMNLKKQDRNDYLVIDGADVVTLDYGQMVARILYGLAGIEPHFEDAYVIPGLENYREGIKKVFNAMLHSDKPLERRPQNTVPLLPDDLSIAEVTDMIKEFHAPVAHAFYAGKGLYLMYHESRVLIAVLLRLIEQGITALPIHDAVIVAEAHKEQTEQVMRQVVKELIGIDCLVRIEEYVSSVQ